MKIHNTYLTLIHQNLTGEISAPDKILLMQWLAENSQNQHRATTIARVWELTGRVEKRQNIAPAKQRSRLLNSIRQIAIRNNKRLVRQRWAAVLLALVLASAALGTLNQHHISILASERQHVSLIHNASIVLHKNASIAFIPSAHTIQANLSGRAFFTFNSQHLATIHCANAKLMADTATFLVTTTAKFSEVTVLTGTVTITLNNDTTILSSNQQAVIHHHTHKLQRIPFNPNTISWYSGVWDFQNMSLEDVTHWLATEYETDFKILDPDLKRASVHTTFVNENFEAIILKLSRHVGFSYTLNNGICEIQSARKS